MISQPKGEEDEKLMTDWLQKLHRKSDGRCKSCGCRVILGVADSDLVCLEGLTIYRDWTVVCGDCHADMQDDEWCDLDEDDFDDEDDEDGLL